jgi:hypothetical protein
MQSEVDKTSVAYLAHEMAKLYKALGPRIVATLREGSRVDTLAGQFELEPVYVNKAGLRWLRDAESLVAPSERENVSLEDLSLAFEVTHDPTEKGWCNRGTVGMFWSASTAKPGETFRNDYAPRVGAW